MSSRPDRRDFLLAMLASGGALASGSLERAWGIQSAPSAAAQQVRRVLVIFKCHFDAGFVDTQEHVVQKYFQKHFPAAIRVARESREQGRPRYVWTTGSWLLYEYLEQASKEDRKNTERAIADGDLAWHALPFSWQTELMDDSQITGSVSLSRSLDARFGKKTNGAKITDVPGHTRGLITPLAASGVTFLDIGVNGASTTADVPPLFLWKDSRGATLAVMYHHDYGGVTQVPNSDLAIAIVVRNDNSGPHTLAETESIYKELKQQFPNAEIVATGLGEIAEARLSLIALTFRSSHRKSATHGSTVCPAIQSRSHAIVRSRAFATSGSSAANSSVVIRLILRSSLTFFSKRNTHGAPIQRLGWTSKTTNPTNWRQCCLQRTIKS